MEDVMGEEGTLEPTSRKIHANCGLLQREASRGVAWNVMGRTERALRLALGGVLIMALTMCDVSYSHYSFKYVGPFLFFVAGTLAPPTLSSAAILLLGGLFSVLLACALATALLSCLLVSSGGRLLCVCAYAICVTWSSFLTVGKTKELTLIGSYIILYTVPLATLIAFPFAYGGISIEVTAERYAAIQHFVANSSMEQIRDALSSLLLLSPETAAGFLTKLTSLEALTVLLGVLSKYFQIHLPPLPPDEPINPKLALNFFLEFFKHIRPTGAVEIEMKLPRDAGLDLPQEWMYDVPLFLDGVSGQHLVFGARPGMWFIKALWVATGGIGIFRNVIMFAAMGFAVYLLVMLVPPIRRQRDVALREMATACGVIRKCLLSVQEELVVAHTTENGRPDQRNGVAEGAEPCSTVYCGAEVAASKACASAGQVVNALDNAVLSLLDIRKAVLLSGMEPFLLYPGPGVWTMKELDDVRRQLIQCCTQTQHAVELLSRQSVCSTPEMTSAGSALVTKCMQMYELFEELLTTFPSVFSPSKSKNRANDLIGQVNSLNGELRSLAMEVIRLLEADSEKALLDLEAENVATLDAGTEDPAAPRRCISSTQSFQHVVELLPVGLAAMSLVKAGFTEPVRLGNAVCALGRAQQVNTLRGLLMNLIFPFVPVVVHINRIVVAPLSALAFWLVKWRGPRAWWRDPETWYAVKLIAVLICIFACAIYLPDFRQYSWGIKVTESPMILDFSTQGLTTRTVLWFLLSYLTVLQTTYNGTVHRCLARIVGIVLGSFSGWLALTCCGSNLAGLIAFCSVTVFIDIFIFADTVHPLDGFHKTWGYSGMVFTWTQSLIVTLALEDVGGLSGDKDYLVTTRILSSIIGSLLAVIAAHLPPVASATTCASSEYSQIMRRCTRGVNNLMHIFLCICCANKDEGFSTSVAEEQPGDGVSSLQGEQEKLDVVVKAVELELKETLGSASRLLREGLYVPVPPWKISRAFEDVEVAANSIVVEAQDAAQLVSDMLKDCKGSPHESVNLLAKATQQELPAVPTAGSTEGASIPLMQYGNCLAVGELFRTTKGIELREALRAVCDSLSTLAAAASVELCNSMPAFGNKLMCGHGGYRRQGDTSGGTQYGYEGCSITVDSNAQRVTEALVECLGEHYSAHREASASRTAAAFVLMMFLYHLQSMKLSLDKVHAAVKEGSRKDECRLVALPDVGRRK